MKPKQPQDARSDLVAWKAAQPENFYLADHQLQRLLRRLGLDAKRRSLLETFGAVVAGPLDRAAEVNNRTANLPRLERWSGIGERIEAIEHHPSYHECGEAIYQDGRVIAAYAGGSHRNLHAQAAFYLSSHVGEAGHNCPVACTAGAVKALAATGSKELQERYLPGLLTPTYEDRLDGAQFLTELQGGSDVGANAVVALPDGEELGTTRWRIHGEKWFCSNADADVIIMTARFDTQIRGTRGLGLFLLPRRLDDGRVNHFTIRRLKDKIGTRSMPSGEIDFNGAVAYAVGPVDEGFGTVMTQVISTSRLYNTVGCAGIMRRAYLVARSYAEARKAFGQPILAFPQVAEMIATMRATSAAVTAGALDLAGRLDAVEAASTDHADAIAFQRVATNLVKLRSCQHSHRVVLTGIETLGGNGAIESFSILPRLLRDNVVYENWEGTHNVLVAQTLRDFTRSKLHEPLMAELERCLQVDDSALADALKPALHSLRRAQRALPEIFKVGAKDSGVAALMLKPHCEALADVWFAAALATDIQSEPDPDRRDAEIGLLRMFAQRNLGASASPEHSVAAAEELARLARLEG